jgi:hypothetical protein
MILPFASCAETGTDIETEQTEPSVIVNTTAPENTEPEETQYPFLEVSYGGEEFLIYNSEPKYNMLMDVIADDANG